MKPTGIIRQIDRLGRVVIPKELRTHYGIQDEDPLEIYTDEDKIILKKYVPSCIFCRSTNRLTQYKDKLVCAKCVEELTALS